ncbi:hypothetical protein Aph01nite_68630 [Acrocarpospora phusangensis]|uniref:Uncharacterized protein n=1 Tax=Acrocarpospora phusangensis TaxID=1070424 RepID=A0A919QGU6_9ACTN|nr:hypothetical protein Aph01nite_68630 [Acrocarpospora phusangensis]
MPVPAAIAGALVATSIAATIPRLTATDPRTLPSLGIANPDVKDFKDKVDRPPPWGRPS